MDYKAELKRVRWIKSYDIERIAIICEEIDYSKSNLDILIEKINEDFWISDIFLYFVFSLDNKLFEETWFTFTIWARDWKDDNWKSYFKLTKGSGKNILNIITTNSFFVKKNTVENLIVKWFLKQEEK